MLEIIKAGGWLMAPIILCSILSLTIIAERAWTLRRKNVVPGDLGEQVRDWASRHELDRRHIEQLRGGSSLGRVLAAGLVNRHRSRHLIKEAIEDTGRHVVHELERFLNTLGTIAGISPLLGLLGTVIGMIETFDSLGDMSLFSQSGGIAGGISQALITTQMGLAVAIPGLVVNGALKRRQKNIEIELAQLKDILCSEPPRRKGA